MFLKEKKCVFFGYVRCLVFCDYSLPWCTAATSKTQCDKTMRKKLGSWQMLELPAAREYLCFKVDMLIALLKVLFYVAFPLFCSCILHEAACCLPF